MTRSWMPHYPGDYLRDTLHLTLEEDGAYRRLIDAYWVNGGLPDDDVLLARIIRVHWRVWKRLAPVLRPFFEVPCDGLAAVLTPYKPPQAGRQIVHKRIDKELARISIFVEKQRRNGARPKAKSKPNASQIETRARVLPQPHPDITSSFHYDVIGARDARAVPPLKKKNQKNLAQKKKKPTQELPDNWQPDQADRDYATGKGMSPEQFESTLDAMRFWAKSKGASYVDWHAAFKGWLRRDALRPQARAGNGHYDDRKYQARDMVGMARQILDEKKQRIAEQENRILKIGDNQHDA